MNSMTPPPPGSRTIFQNVSESRAHYYGKFLNELESSNELCPSPSLLPKGGD